MTNNEKLDELLKKLTTLSLKQDSFSMEINELRREINILKLSETSQASRVKPIIPVQPEEKKESVESKYELKIEPVTEKSANDIPKTSFIPPVKSDLEKFIGENLINKVGIVILIIGIAIGAKYSIDHDLISPLTRIILGYLQAVALLVFGIRLKKNYEKYSAVLVSGSIAIMYFITFAAYSFYGLLPQTLTFLLMTTFTVFAVIAAIHYNLQVIAHIGLVGAYAVPFLLSDGSGRVAVLFSYMAIINIGILAISFRKYWKSLFYSAFIITWLIYFSWYISDYREVDHFKLALLFSFIFFCTFYLTFLLYKLIRKEKYESTDVALLIINSLFYYSAGYIILATHKTGQEFLGLFTMLNAIIHFIVSVVVYRNKLADRNLFFLLSGLVLVFITIAIPVQLDGNWVTLLWITEATLLFWIGRTKNVPTYEKLSYPLMLLAVLSLFQDWAMDYETYFPGGSGGNLTPLLNINFLSSLIVIGCLSFICYLLSNEKSLSVTGENKNSFINYAVPAILLIIIYMAIRMEITNYTGQLYFESAVDIKKGDITNTDYNADLPLFEKIWLLIYSLGFLAALAIINLKKIRNKTFGVANIVLSFIFIIATISVGLMVLVELRNSYLTKELSEFYIQTGFNIGIRYILFAFAALNLYFIHTYIMNDYIEPKEVWKTALDILIHLCIIVIASSELVTWMTMLDFPQSHKLGLSILWGFYSLLLIALGIWKKKKHLRIGAIVLFGVTLVKLFLYDIVHLDTIARTIVFVSLGILLLIISFLYNKYKKLIDD